MHVSANYDTSDDDDAAASGSRDHDEGITTTTSSSSSSSHTQSCTKASTTIIVPMIVAQTSLAGTGSAFAFGRRRSRSSNNSTSHINSCSNNQINYYCSGRVMMSIPSYCARMSKLTFAFILLTIINSINRSVSSFFVAGLSTPTSSSTPRSMLSGATTSSHYHRHDRSPFQKSPPPLKGGCQHLYNRSVITDNYWPLLAKTQSSSESGDSILMMKATATGKQKKTQNKSQPQHSTTNKGRSAGGGSTSRSNSSGSNNSYYSKNNVAARNFNSRLTGCNTVSELLSAFMDQTSASSGDGGDDKSYNNSSSSSTSKRTATTTTTHTRSAATHLAGANKVNSVNFSTCLHRLARFATDNTKNVNEHATTTNHRISNNPANNSEIGEDDQRRKALSDPRFALLVCSMAEMACGCDASLSIGEGQAILENWKKSNVNHHDSLRDGGGGDSSRRSMSEMEEADDVLIAIAGSHINSDIEQQQKVQQRRISSAKYAMDQLSLSNQQRTTNSFSSRECSNVCWALAKLRMAPPGNALPMGRVMVSIDGSESATQEESTSSMRTNNIKLFVSIEEMALDVLDSSLQVRMKLYEEARSRKKMRDGSMADSSAIGESWIPELSRLAGKVLDLIAVQIINEYGLRLRHNDVSGNADGGGRGETKHGVDQSHSSGAARTTPTAANSQEMASLLYAFAKAGRGDDSLFSVVAKELMRQTSKVELDREGKRGPKPQEFSNTIWAFATAGVRGIAHVELIRFLANALDEGNGLFFGFEFKPQERSNVAWAVASLHSKRSNSAGDAAMREEEDLSIVRNLRWVAKSIIQNVDHFKPQELSNSIWAFSTVGFGYDETCGTNSHNDYIHVETDDPTGDKKLVYDALEVIARNALPRLDKFKAQELNNLAWGYSRLGHRSERAEKLFSGVAKELIRRTWQFKPQDIGTTLWSMATSEYFDYDAFRAGASRLNLRQIRAFKPQEMSNTVWALATAGFAPAFIRAFDTTLVPSSQRPTKEEVNGDPITECFAAVASEAMRRPHEFKDQEIKDILWSFSKAGVRHPALFQKIAKHLVGPQGRGLSTFSSQGLGNTLWSYAKQAGLSLDVIESLGDTVKLVSTGRLAVYETSCLDNGENVIKRLFVEAAEAAMGMGLHRFTNQDISNTVWAYSTLGILHSSFFKEVEIEVVTRLIEKRSKFRGQEISNILWSFATLNAQPDPSMVDALGTYVASECRGKNGVDEVSVAKLFGQRQELANLAWSCAVIGRYPKNLMNILYTGLVGTSNDPEQMKRVFNDDGLQKSSIMTLYYVQVAADVEAPHLRLSLPLGFPNGWGEDETHMHTKADENDLIQLSSSMLTLTVSKLQKAVSSTFNKIGFANVLEHVIDTNEIKDEYGIQLPHSPKEFLSIDIANVEKRVGIEVDGPGHFVRLIDKPGTSLSRNFDDRGENRVNGPTMLKHRLLTHLGWHIIHLPYWEFQDLAGDKAREMAYCQQLLNSRIAADWVPAAEAWRAT